MSHLPKPPHARRELGSQGQLVVGELSIALPSNDDRLPGEKRLTTARQLHPTASPALQYKRGEPSSSSTIENDADDRRDGRHQKREGVGAEHGEYGSTEHHCTTGAAH